MIPSHCAVCGEGLEKQRFDGEDNYRDDNDDESNADDVAADVSRTAFLDERFAHFSLAFHHDGAVFAFRPAAAHVRLPGAVRLDDLRYGLFAKIDLGANSLSEHRRDALGELRD